MPSPATAEVEQVAPVVRHWPVKWMVRRLPGVIGNVTAGPAAHVVAVDRAEVGRVVEAVHS